jgi:hypothetical protein
MIIHLLLNQKKDEYVFKILNIQLYFRKLGRNVTKKEDKKWVVLNKDKK